MRAEDIVDTYTVLSGLMKKRLPIRMSQIIGRNMKKIKPIVKETLETRDELIRKYGKRDENGELIQKGLQTELGDTDSFYRDEKELYDTEFSVVFDKFDISVLERCDTLEFDSPTGEEVAALECMMMEA